MLAMAVLCALGLCLLHYGYSVLCSLLWPNSYGGILPLTATSYVAYALQLWLRRSGAASGCAQATLGRPSRSRTVRWRGRGFELVMALITDIYTGAAIFSV